MSALVQDLRDAFRHLRSRPGFTTVVVLTLSMGIGLNAAVFTAVDAALLRSLPYAEPERLVHVFQDRGDMPRFELAWPTVRELQADRSVFASVAGYSRGSTVLTNGGERSQVLALRVSASFFDVLGVRPQLGRTFLPGEDEDGGPRAVVLSDAFWRSQMGADPSVLGRSVVLDDLPFTIVGVLPPTFPFAPGGDARMILAAQPKGDFLRRNLNWVNTIARLRDGVTLRAAQQGATAFSAALRDRFPQEMKGVSMVVVPLRDVLVGKVEPVLVLLFACVSLVLLVACANVANLLLARARSREQEMAVRAALGAGRRRLVQQLLTESAVLATLGGILGILAARLSLPLLLVGIPARERATMPFLQDLGVDGRVLAYGAGLILLTTVLFGLLPALRASRPDLHDALKDPTGSSRQGGPLRHGLRGSLVALEVALAVMLLGSAALMGKSLLRVLSTDPGYRPQGALGAMVILPDARVAKDEAAIAIQGEILRSVGAVPGVTGITRVNQLPGTGNGNTLRFVREDRPRPTGAEPEVAAREVGPDLLPGPRRAAARGPGLRHRGRVRHPAGRGGQPRAPAPLLPRGRPGRQAHPTHLRAGRPRSSPSSASWGTRPSARWTRHRRRSCTCRDAQFPSNPFALVLRQQPRGGPGRGASRDPSAAPDAVVLPVRSLTEVL